MSKKIKKNTDIPLNDPDTYELIGNTNNMGVFQISGEGMSGLANTLKPKSIKDLAVVIALYRPGPLNSGVVDSYINRKYGQEEIVYDHPKLEPILKDTYGLFVFQEQVISTCIHLAGFSEIEADKIRKIIGKKNQDEKVLKAEENKFVKGCVSQKVKKETAQEIWNKIVEFSGYGFNLSHAVGYAHISYYTAYLKTHYPLEFYSSLLNSTIGKVEKMQKIITDIIVNKIKILPPDIVKSNGYFKPEGDSIRYGLRGVFSIGDKIMDIIRDQEYEYCLNILPKDNLEYLIKAGAFDEFNNNRRLLLKKYSGKKISKVDSNFNLMNLDVKYNIKDWDNFRRIQEQHSALKVYIGDNPVQLKLKKYPELKYYPEMDFKDLAPGQIVKTVGMITELKEIITKNGYTMAIGQYLDQWNQTVRCVFWPKNYQKLKPKLHAIYSFISEIKEPEVLCVYVEKMQKL